MSFLRNPELVRNVWLELTLQRLVVMPAVLGAIFFVTRLASDSLDRLGSFALFGFGVITLFWGAKLAADSMSDELDQGTWDTQRLSSLTAWQMATGKLFGGPVFAWYGGAICAVVFLSTTTLALVEALQVLAVTAGMAIALHAISILGSIGIWRRGVARRASGRGTWAIFALLAFLLMPHAMTLHQAAESEVTWYGRGWNGWHFTLFSTASAVFWSVLGLYRSMRAELSFRQAPTAWIAFILYLDFYIGGWFYGEAVELPNFAIPRSVVHLSFCALFAVGLTYVVLFSERKDWVRLRRLLAGFREGAWRRAAELVPRWLATLAVALCSLVALIVAAVLMLDVSDGAKVATLATAFGLCLLRDTGIVLAISFSADQRRTDSAALLYIAVLSLLVPAILLAVGSRDLLPAVVPYLAYDQPAWLLGWLAQAVLGLAYARRRWMGLPRPN
jgi:hypothetical protein